MTASRDTERLIRAFLDEGVTELPERVYDVVRSDIDRTHQRVVIGPWRTPDMNTFAKFAMAAAAVLVVAIVGYNLLPSEHRDRGDSHRLAIAIAVTASPSITASPLPSPPPSDYTFFPDGSIEAGRHPMILSGKSLTVDMPLWLDQPPRFSDLHPVGRRGVHLLDPRAEQCLRGSLRARTVRPSGG